MSNEYIKHLVFNHNLIKPSDINTTINILENNVGGVKRFKVFPKVVKFYFENRVPTGIQDTISHIESSTSLTYRKNK